MREGLTVLLIVLGAAYSCVIMYRAYKWYQANDPNINTDMSRVASRMAAGALLGGGAFLAGYCTWASLSGFTEGKVNPYIWGLPTFGAILSACAGAVVGSLMSLVSRKWKR